MQSQLNSRSASPSISDDDLFAELLPPTMKRHSRTSSTYSPSNTPPPHHHPTNVFRVQCINILMRSEALMMVTLLQFFLKNDPSLKNRISLRITEPVKECVVGFLRDGFLLTYVYEYLPLRKLLRVFVRDDCHVEGFGNIEGVYDNHDGCMTNLEILVAFMTVKGQVMRVPSARELLICDVFECSPSITLFVVKHILGIHEGIGEDIAGMSRTTMQSNTLVD